MDTIFHLLRQEDLDLSDYEFSHKEIAGEYKREFVFLAERVYNSCLIYFELKGITRYIDEFKSTYKHLLNSTNGNQQSAELADLVYMDIYGDEESKITKIFRQALYPFRAFGSGDEKHLTGLDYLE